MKKLINKMATPIFSKITMTTRIGAEPWKRKRRRGVRGHVESPSEVALLLGLGGRRVSRPQRTDLHPPANDPEVFGSLAEFLQAADLVRKV